MTLTSAHHPIFCYCADQSAHESVNCKCKRLWEGVEICAGRSGSKIKLKGKKCRLFPDSVLFNFFSLRCSSGFSLTVRSRAGEVNWKLSVRANEVSLSV